MIYVLQILGILNKEERELFVSLFSDLSFEIEELGYEGMEEELIEGLLFDHFGLEFTDRDQLTMMCDYIMEKQNHPIWESILVTVNLMKRGA